MNLWSVAQTARRRTHTRSVRGAEVARPGVAGSGTMVSATAAFGNTLNRSRFAPSVITNSPFSANVGPQAPDQVGAVAHLAPLLVAVIGLRHRDHGGGIRIALRYGRADRIADTRS